MNDHIVRDTIKQRVLVTFLMLIAIVSMTIGYAVYSEELKIMANITLDSDVGFSLVSVEVEDDLNALNEEISIQDNDDELILNSKQVFTFITSLENDSLSNYIIYRFNLRNMTDKDYMFSSLDVAITNDGELVLDNPILMGMSEGDILASGETKDVTLTYFSSEAILDDIKITANTNFIFTDDLDYEVTSNIVSSISDDVNTLNEDNIGSFKLELMSTFSYSTYYSVILDDENFIMVDQNGNELDKQYIIKSGVNTSEEIFIRLKDGIILTDEVKVMINIKDSQSNTYECGVITILSNENLS